MKTFVMICGAESIVLDNDNIKVDAGTSNEEKVKLLREAFDKELDMNLTLEENQKNFVEKYSKIVYNNIKNVRVSDKEKAGTELYTLYDLTVNKNLGIGEVVILYFDSLESRIAAIVVEKIAKERFEVKDEAIKVIKTYIKGLDLLDFVNNNVDAKFMNSSIEDVFKVTSSRDFIFLTYKNYMVLNEYWERKLRSSRIKTYFMINIRGGLYKVNLETNSVAIVNNPKNIEDEE